MPKHRENANYPLVAFRPDPLVLRELEDRRAAGHPNRSKVLNDTLRIGFAAIRAYESDSPTRRSGGSK